MNDLSPCDNRFPKLGISTTGLENTKLSARSGAKKVTVHRLYIGYTEENPRTNYTSNFQTISLGERTFRRFHGTLISLVFSLNFGIAKYININNYKFIEHTVPVGELRLN